MTQQNRQKQDLQDAQRNGGQKSSDNPARQQEQAGTAQQEQANRNMRNPDQQGGQASDRASQKNKPQGGQHHS